MIALGPGAWLVAGLLLFCWGLVDALSGRDERDDPTAVLAMLGGAVVVFGGLVRHQILGTGGLVVALLVLIGGVVLLLAGPPDHGKDDR
jgi:predicted permease